MIHQNLMDHGDDRIMVIHQNFIHPISTAHLSCASTADVRLRHSRVAHLRCSRRKGRSRAAWRRRGDAGSVAEHRGKTEETMAKTWGNTRENVGKTWESIGKIQEKHWEIMGTKPWEKNGMNGMDL